MSITAQLTDGTTTIDLIYDPGTQDEYALHYGMRVEMLETEVLQHVPDYGDSRPVRAQDPDRTAFATLHVLGDDNDAVTNSLITLRRWIDGANQQALAYHMGGNANEITFNVAADGATNTTVNSVKWGFVDDSGSFYGQYKREGGFARNVVVMLRLEPYGRAASTFNLNNYLTSSPHFVEDTDADGLADGWSEVNGAETTTIDTTYWLIGGKSQKVVAGTDNYGIGSDTVSNSSDTSAVAYAWVYVASGTALVQLWDVTSAAEIDSATCSLANSDKTAVDLQGNTWWRIPVSGTMASGNDVNLFIRASGGAATFYVDGCYLELGTQTAPDAWMSARAIDNRNDIQSTSAATENYLNYVDVWGIPGDAPALTTWKLNASVATIQRLFAGATTDGTYMAADQDHWIEDDDYDARASTSGTWSDQTGTSNDSYIRFTEAGSPTYDGASVRFDLSGDAARQFFASQRRLFVLARASTTAQTVQADIIVGSSTYAIGEAVSVTTASTWELLDLGTIITLGVLPDSVPDTTEPTISFQLTIAGTGAGTTFDIDALYPIFIDSGFMIVDFNEVSKSNGDFWIVGAKEIVVNENTGIAESGVLGEFWTQPAGNISTRNTFAFTSGDAAFTLTHQIVTGLVLTPRTRHLLGTI